MRIATLIGTRPEEIKMQPVIDALQERGVDVWSFQSGQSPDLVEAQEDTPRWDSLQDGIARIIAEMDFSSVDALLVQGDTATAFAGAVAGFLAEVPVGHVEAGLRTYEREPRPEEQFRGMIARVATWHFCPDEDSYRNIVMELGHVKNFAELAWDGKPDNWPWQKEQAPAAQILGLHNAFITGNPIIDTLPSQPLRVLATLHRRENWGERIEGALRALSDFQGDHARSAEVRVIRHPNWEAQGIDTQLCAPNLIYREPVDHATFLSWMRQSDVVVTDSGGLQEEAAHFGIPCIVVRSATERKALERGGSVQLVDPDDSESLLVALESILAQRRAYGDGNAGQKIAEILVNELGEGRPKTERMGELANANK